MTMNIRTAWVRRPGEGVDQPLESIEDEATLAEIRISVDDLVFTRAEDRETELVRDHGRLSAYRLGEWLTWKWWRLRWEPQRQNAPDFEWAAAHRMSGIGGGWLWPNISVVSDGARIVITTKPTALASTEPLRYIADHAAVIPATDFENALDDFMDHVMNRLREWPLGGTDLERNWAELAAERADPDLALYRRLEAMLGCDPDEARPEVIAQILSDADILGVGAVSEVAADPPTTANDLRERAVQSGFDARFANGAQPAPDLVPANRQSVPAWQIGVRAAQKLRERERLRDGPVTNDRLTELCGVSEASLTDRVRHDPEMAFALMEDGQERIVLRSRWETGRRFELARLLGDRLLDDQGERLHPATTNYTYRQKMQRAFAAEFLCPITSLREFLDDDFSQDAQEDAAQEFNVSPMTVSTLLANNRLIDRDEMYDPDAQAA